MSVETTSFSNKRTWETTLLQRGLVDNCFEEGQYEIAIATLDQLRSPEFNPWPPHIRQLIYISLQSTEETSRLDEFEHSQTSSSKQASPSKSLKKQHYSLNHIPAKAISDAQRLLTSYLSTNSPKSLARSLPTRKSLSGLTHDGDSLVSKRSICITQCKDCWEFLRSDFLSRHDTSSVVMSQRSLSINAPSRDAVEDSVVSCVSDFSWPVLKWLVSLFEIDERENDTGNARYSPLLAEQIIDSNGKVYIETSVSIVMHCIQQKQPLYQRLAPRLLSLLAGLTTSSQVDLQTVVVALYTRLASTDIVRDIPRLFSQTNQSAAILRLKLALYSKFVAAKKDFIDKPRPQPRSRLRSSKQNGNSDTVEPPRKSHNPTATEILHLFQLESPKADTTVNDSSPTTLWFKHQLLTTYGTLQIILPTKDRDSDWLRLLNGGLDQIVRNILQNQGSEGDLYQKLLESQIATWKLSQPAPT